MFNPYLQKQAPRLSDGNAYLKRKDEFPHPERQCIFHITSTLHNPKYEVVYLNKDEASHWRASHIDSFNKEEWFNTLQEALDAKKSQLVNAKRDVDDAKKKLDAKSKKDT